MSFIDENATIAKRISDTITVLRFPLLLMVVLIHCSLRYKIGSSSPCSIASDIMYFFSGCLCSIAVPTYFFMSGYLFFGILGQKRLLTINNYFERIHKRFYRLFIPYIIWNLIGFCLMVLFMKTSLKSFFPGLNIDINLNYFFRCFWSVTDLHSFFQTAGAPVDDPMWFIRDLIILSILSPIVYSIIRVFRFWILLPLTGLFICGIWPHLIGFSLTGILFYVLGAYCSITKLDFITPLGRAWWSILIALLIMILETLIRPIGYPYIHSLTIIFGVIACLYLAVRFSKNRSTVNRMSSLANLGFFVFASHMMISSETKTFICQLFNPSTDIGWLMCYVFVFIILFTLPTLLYLILKQISPTILNLLVGSYTSPKKI